MNEQLKILVAAILDKAMSESNINSQLKQLKIDNLKLNVDINSSTATIKSEVQKASQKVNQYIKSSVVTPINIPFQFDTKSPANIKAEMEKIVQSIGGSKGSLVDYKINTNMVLDKDGKKQTEELTGATLQYRNALNEVVTAQIKYQQIGIQNGEIIMGWSTATQQYHQNIEKTIALQQKQIEADAKVARSKAILESQVETSLKGIDSRTLRSSNPLIADSKQFDDYNNKVTETKSNIQKLVSENETMSDVHKEQINSMIKDLERYARELQKSAYAGTKLKADTFPNAKEQALSKLTTKELDWNNSGILDAEFKKKSAELRAILEKTFDSTSLAEYRSKLKLLDDDFDRLKKNQAKSKFDFNLDFDKTKLNDSITIWLNKNQRAAKAFGADLANIQSQIQKADRTQLTNLNKQFQSVQKSAGALNLTGRTFFGELANSANKFKDWFLIGGVVTSVVRSFTSAITELKEIDTQLTEISKTSELTTQQLKELGNASFDAANKYGATVIGYLEGVREFSRAGKENAQALAEVSILAQSAGDLTADTANKYLLATDAAYALGGSEERLTEVLDAQNQVTNRNAVDMEQLAQATMVAGSQAAQSGIAVDQLTAAVSTMAIVTQQGGDIAGRAFKGILMNLQQVSGELDGEIIDEESFKKVEKSLDAVGVSMSTVVDGAVRMREPMEILKELSQVYNSLDDLDPKKAAIISDLGGKYRGNEYLILIAPYVQKCA